MFIKIMYEICFMFYTVQRIRQYQKKGNNLYKMTGTKIMKQYRWYVRTQTHYHTTCCSHCSVTEGGESAALAIKFLSLTNIIRSYHANTVHDDFFHLTSPDFNTAVSCLLKKVRHILLIWRVILRTMTIITFFIVDTIVLLLK